MQSERELGGFTGYEKRLAWLMTLLQPLNLSFPVAEKASVMGNPVLCSVFCFG